jgi:hypothetical protein
MVISWLSVGAAVCLGTVGCSSSKQTVPQSSNLDVDRKVSSAVAAQDNKTVVEEKSAQSVDLRAFPTDITQGNIRLVLMSVGQITVFPNDKDNAVKAPTYGGGKQGVPCFTVTFLVESLGDGPIRNTAFGPIEILSAGKPLQLASKREYSQSFDYNEFQEFLDFTKPKVTNPKRAFIRRHVEFRAVPNFQPFTLEIQAGFNKDLKKFKFESVRLQ